MHSSIVTVLALATAAVALPSVAMEKRQASIPPGTFTNASCTLSKGLTPGIPGIQLFPTADALGAILGPVLSATLGSETVNDIDIIADELCM